MASLKVLSSRFSADALSKLLALIGVDAAPLSTIIVSKSWKDVSDTSTSEGASRANSGPSNTKGRVLTLKSPVEISTQASAEASRICANAARKLCRRASSKLSSVSVPGVTRRTTSRFTTDLLPRFFASAGLSICSQTATRKPFRISVSKYPSEA